MAVVVQVLCMQCVCEGGDVCVCEGGSVCLSLLHTHTHTATHTHTHTHTHTQPYMHVAATVAAPVHLESLR